MAKRKDINPEALSSLLSEHARPMTDATPISDSSSSTQTGVRTRPAGSVPTHELVNLSFKVPTAFRKRFRDLAHENDLNKVGLLFAALDAFDAANKG